MLKDLGRIFFFIKSNDGKRYRNLLLIVATILVLLILLNRFYLIKNVNDDFKIAYNQSKLLFKNGLSPYESEGMGRINQIALEEGWSATSDNKNLGNPIFQYFFFYPFTIINNYEWSQTIFITINQIFIFISTKLLLDFMKWNPSEKEIIITLIISSFAFFVISPMMSSNVSALQLVLCVGVLYFSERNKYVLSGFLLACTFIDPIGIFYFFITFIIILMKQNKYVVFLWTTITISLFTLASFIFVKSWITGWLKILFLTRSRYPFISFIFAAENKFNLQYNRLFTIIPIFIGLWLFLELVRTPKDRIDKNIWLLSLAGILNYYLMVQPKMGSETLFLPAFIILIGVWSKKFNLISKIGLYLFLGIFSLGFLFWQNSLIVLSTKNYESMLLFSAFFLITNIYWIRPWIIKPYEVETEKTKYL
jgi:hypothetical protein